MEKEKKITTAANSKAMNAVDNENLFAAAGETGAYINFADAEMGKEAVIIAPSRDKPLLAAKRNTRIIQLKTYYPELK